MLTLKFSLLTICAMYAFLSLPNKTTALGSSKDISGNDLKIAVDVLKNALSKLSAGGGRSYKLQKVNSASKQVVSGILYKYNVDLINSDKNVRNCNVEIWAREWLANGNQVTIACRGEQVIRYNA